MSDCCPKCGSFREIGTSTEEADYIRCGDCHFIKQVLPNVGYSSQGAQD